MAQQTPLPPVGGQPVDLSGLFGTIRGFLPQTAPNGTTGALTPLGGTPGAGGGTRLPGGFCVDLCKIERLVEPMGSMREGMKHMQEGMGRLANPTEAMEKSMVQMLASMERMEDHMKGVYAAVVVLVLIFVILVVFGIVGGACYFRGQRKSGRISTSASETMRYTK